MVEQYNKFELYREDTTQEFVNHLKRDSIWLTKVFKKKKCLKKVMGAEWGYF